MKVFRPKNIKEAISLQQEHGGHYIAGGTFTMVEVNADRFHPQCLIDLSLCEALHGVCEDGEAVFVGALMTFAQIEKNELLKELFPALTKAASEVGGPQVRNRGTIGGNICAASPAADIAPPLLALGAKVIAEGADGTREIPVSEIFLAPKKNCLKDEEIVKYIVIPKTDCCSAFIKVGKRNALAVSSVSMAAAGKYDGGKLTQLKIAAGSCAPTPRLCPKTAEALLGKELTEETVAAAKELLLQEIAPIDDRWATAEYRRMVAQNMLEKLLSEIG